MRALLVLILLLALGCTAPAVAKKPGLYECRPTSLDYQHLEPIRFDSRTADARMDLPPLETAITLTSIEGRRVALRLNDPARWKCEILIDYEAEKEQR